MCSDQLSVADYSNWDSKQLQSWLKEHNIETPKGYSQQELQDLVKSNWNTVNSWTQDQYSYAQQVFADGRDKSIESWKDSELRDALVSLGVATPPTARESLVHAVKQAYNTYSASATSFVSGASAAASTAVYGDKQYQASKSVSSLYSSATDSVSNIAAQSTEALARQLDDSKDYVYSTWDDNQLRSYLEENGVIKTKQQVTRDQMLGYMRDTYAKAADPLWQSWSDSYLVCAFFILSGATIDFLSKHEWLVSHGVIKSDFEKKRDALVKQMQHYYYTPQQHVWDTWTDSQLRQWLIEHELIKSDAQIKKEKMQKLVASVLTYFHHSALTLL